MCFTRNADLIRTHNAIEMNYAKIPVTHPVENDSTSFCQIVEIERRNLYNIA